MYKDDSAKVPTPCSAKFGPGDFELSDGNSGHGDFVLSDGNSGHGDFVLSDGNSGHDDPCKVHVSY